MHYMLMTNADRKNIEKQIADLNTRARDSERMTEIMAIRKQINALYAKLSA